METRNKKHKNSPIHMIRSNIIFYSKTMNAASAAANTVPLSVYISRLRRAFLLRVHPDRFRSQSEKVRKEQATLVQVISDRLGENDFVDFAAQRRQVR